MAEEHLTDSAMMTIHRDIHLNVNQIIDAMVASPARSEKFHLFVHVVAKVTSVFYFYKEFSLIKMFLLKMIILLLYS